MKSLPPRDHGVASGARRNFSSIEVLESRIAPTGGLIFKVTTLKDVTDANHDTGSLRDAIFNADAAGGSIVFEMTAGTKTAPLRGTINLLSDLPEITNNVTITGPVAGKSNGIMINGHSHQIINITGGTTVNLTDLTVTKGQSKFGGGIFVSDAGGTVNLTDVNVTGNK